MVTIFHLMALILCCNRGIPRQSIDDRMLEERRQVKEYKRNNLEVLVPNNKEE